MAGKRIVCIEIRDSFVRVVEQEIRGKKISVMHAVEFKTPEEAFSDGYITDTETMADAITMNLRSAGIKTKKVIFNLVSNKVMSRDAVIPIVKKSQLRSVVMSQADEYFPIELDEHVISYSVLDTDKEEKTMSMMIYAVPEDMVNSYYDLAAASGMKLVALDYTGNASFQWMRSSLSERFPQDETMMLMQIGLNSTVATIVTGKTMGMQRNINHGINALTDTVVECGLAADVDDAVAVLRKTRHLNPFLPGHVLQVSEMTPEQQKRYLKTLNVGDGVSKQLTDEEARQMAEQVQIKTLYVPDEGNNEFNEVITESTRQLINNIARFIDYFAVKNKTNPVIRLVIAGTGMDIQGLGELIQNETGLEVVLMRDVPGGYGIKGEKLFDNLNFSNFISVIGSGISPVGFIPIDIIREEKRKADTWRLLRMIVIILILCMVIVVAGLLNHMGAKGQNDVLRQERDELSYVQSIYSEYQKAFNVNQEVNAIDASTERMNELLSKLFTDLEMYLPRTSVITSMSSMGDSMTLSMKVDSKETAAKLIMQLKSIPYLSDVATTGITDTTDETTGARAVEFSLTCYFAPDALEEEVNDSASTGADEITDLPVDDTDNTGYVDETAEN